jgi:hypothetical protein
MATSEMELSGKMLALFKDQKEIQAIPELKEIKATRATKEILELLDHRLFRVTKVFRVTKGRKVSLVIKVFKENLDQTLLQTLLKQTLMDSYSETA